jgi:hypothetical protein
MFWKRNIEIDTNKRHKIEPKGQKRDLHIPHLEMLYSYRCFWGIFFFFNLSHKIIFNNEQTIKNNQTSFFRGVNSLTQQMSRVVQLNEHLLLRRRHKKTTKCCSHSRLNFYVILYALGLTECDILYSICITTLFFYCYRHSRESPTISGPCRPVLCSNFSALSLSLSISFGSKRDGQHGRMKVARLILSFKFTVKKLKFHNFSSAMIFQ